MLVGKVLVDASESIGANLFDEIFEFVVVMGSEFSRVRVDDCDEGCGFLAEELAELFEMFVHLRDCLDHLDYIIQNNDLSLWIN